MALLFDSDYEFLSESGLKFVEDEESRFLIFMSFPLPVGVYKSADQPIDCVDVLYVVPQNYNTEGGDMFWVNCKLERIDGVAIPNINGPGEDSRKHGEIEYLRWSRHWNNTPWQPKIDNIQTIIDRLTWAFRNPDAKRS